MKTSLVHAALIANLILWSLSLFTLTISAVLRIIKTDKDPTNESMKDAFITKCIVVISVFLLVLFW